MTHSVRKIKLASVIIFGFITTVILTAWSSTKEDHAVYNKTKSERKAFVISSMELYDCIIKYSEIYKVPKNIAFGIAYSETKYKSPYDVNYNHGQKSFAGALGPMQVMPMSAKYIWKCDTITNSYLKENIDFNVHTSMKLLCYYKKKHGSWLKALGAYNTGKPIVNDYAKKTLSYKFKWRTIKHN